MVELIVQRNHASMWEPAQFGEDAWADDGDFGGGMSSADWDSSVEWEDWRNQPQKPA
eukprot:SAG11_NODE_1418_length_4962_cov_3.782644_6_plen_57_part_00